MPVPTPFDHILFKINLAFSDANSDISSCVAADLHWIKVRQIDMELARTPHEFEIAACEYDHICRRFFTLGYVRQNAEVK